MISALTHACTVEAEEKGNVQAALLHQHLIVIEL